MNSKVCLFSLENIWISGNQCSLSMHLCKIITFHRMCLIHPSKDICQSTGNDIMSDARWEITLHHHFGLLEDWILVFPGLCAHSTYDKSCFPAYVWASGVIQAFCLYSHSKCSASTYLAKPMKSSWLVFMYASWMSISSMSWSLHRASRSRTHEFTIRSVSSRRRG